MVHRRFSFYSPDSGNDPALAAAFRQRGSGCSPLCVTASPPSGAFLSLNPSLGPHRVSVGRRRDTIHPGYLPFAFPSPQHQQGLICLDSTGRAHQPRACGVVSADPMYQCPMSTVSRVSFQQQFAQEATRVTQEVGCAVVRARAHRSAAITVPLSDTCADVGYSRVGLILPAIRVRHSASLLLLLSFRHACESRLYVPWKRQRRTIRPRQHKDGCESQRSVSVLSSGRQSSNTHERLLDRRATDAITE